MNAQTPTTQTLAPFYDDVAEGPDGAVAWWVTAQDGTRLRMGVWPEGSKGTVIMCPGRTEYVEKYGRVARDMANAGYGMVAFDWRGQGLADRPDHDRGMGHVLSFDEYRQDVAAFRAALEVLEVPKPWYLIGHSMGGCIGLRALYDGFPAKAAAFTGPMWALQMSAALKVVSPLLLSLAGPLGFGEKYTVTKGPWEKVPFEGNALTTDSDQYEYMELQTDTYPDLTLGGPSFTWVKQAIDECTRLMAMAPLDLPVVSIVGSEESIVDIETTKDRMASWPKGRFVNMPGGRHEVLMERPDLRDQTLSLILELFDANPA